jgi:MSHA biogenesis protein MshJ
MKAQWIKLTIRLDAMSLRERAMVFAAVTCAILFIAYSMVLEPLLAQQKKLLAEIGQQQNQIGGIDGEITQKIAAFQADPDAQLRQHLSDVRREIQDADAALRSMQKGLVAPDQIVPLLEHILRGNGKLRLLSLKTLPAAGLSEQGFKEAAGDQDVKPAAATPLPPAVGAVLGASALAPPAAASAPPGAAALPSPVLAPPVAAAAAVKPRELLYRHGVEIELQGSYLDMVNYMTALEALPEQLFWGRAKLDAEQYPQVKLTLTLYTMSLDDQWMKL